MGFPARADCPFWTDPLAVLGCEGKRITGLWHRYISLDPPSHCVRVLKRNYNNSARCVDPRWEAVSVDMTEMFMLANTFFCGDQMGNYMYMELSFIIILHVNWFIKYNFNPTLHLDN